MAARCSTTSSKAVQSIYGSELLYEELTARDASSGYFVTSIKLSTGKGGTVVYWLSLVCILVSACLVAMSQGIIMVLVIVVLLVFHQSFFSGTSEAVLAVGKVGIEVIEEQKWWGGRGSSQFIPLSAIDNVIINEAIYRHRVIFYLALLVHTGKSEDDTKIIPLFTSQMPRLETILSIYRILKSTLSNQDPV